MADVGWIDCWFEQSGMDNQLNVGLRGAGNFHIYKYHSKLVQGHLQVKVTLRPVLFVNWQCTVCSFVCTIGMMARALCLLHTASEGHSETFAICAHYVLHRLHRLHVYKYVLQRLHLIDMIARAYCILHRFDESTCAQYVLHRLHRLHTASTAQIAHWRESKSILHTAFKWHKSILHTYLIFVT